MHTSSLTRGYTQPHSHTPDIMRLQLQKVEMESDANSGEEVRVWKARLLPEGSTRLRVHTRREGLVSATI
jgi:hypothetical protein